MCDESTIIETSKTRFYKLPSHSQSILGLSVKWRKKIKTSVKIITYNRFRNLRSVWGGVGCQAKVPRWGPRVSKLSPTVPVGAWVSKLGARSLGLRLGGGLKRDKCTTYSLPNPITPNGVMIFVSWCYENFGSFVSLSHLWAVNAMWKTN